MLPTGMMRSILSYWVFGKDVALRWIIRIFPTGGWGEYPTSLNFIYSPDQETPIRLLSVPNFHPHPQPKVNSPPPPPPPPPINNNFHVTIQ